MLCLWPGPPWFKKWFPLILACSRGLAKSTLSLCRNSDRFDFMFSLRCIELESHYVNRTFNVFFVLRIISGPRMKFVQ